MDIFSLGQCLKTLNFVIILNGIHPLSTTLPYMKTTQTNYYKNPTKYDDIDSFLNVDKCNKGSSECNMFY